MNIIRKPLIDYIEYDGFNTWSSITMIALDNLMSEITKEFGTIPPDIEETLKDLISNVYIEAFRDGTEFRRWMDSPLFWLVQASITSKFRASYGHLNLFRFGNKILVHSMKTLTNNFIFVNQWFLIVINPLRNAFSTKRTQYVFSIKTIDNFHWRVVSL